MERGGHGKTWHFFHGIGKALATAGKGIYTGLKDVDHYALGDFFKQDYEGWKEEINGVKDVFKHIGSAKGWKELGEGLADHAGDAAEVADPFAGTVANQFAHSLVHGQTFDQALENGGMALAGGALGEAGGRIGGKLMSKFGESEAGKALKGALGKIVKKSPEKFGGVTSDQFLDKEDQDLLDRVQALRNRDLNPETSGLTQLTPQALNPGMEMKGLSGEGGRTEEDIMDTIHHSLVYPDTPEELAAARQLDEGGPSRGKNEEDIMKDLNDRVNVPDTAEELEGDHQLEEGIRGKDEKEVMDKIKAILNVDPTVRVTDRQPLNEVRPQDHEDGDEFHDLPMREQTESYDFKKLRRQLYKKLPSRRSLYKKIPTRKGLYKGAKREAWNLGKSIYKGIPQTMKEEGGKYLVERALRPLEGEGGEEHFDMMHDGGSTGLGGDNPCPPGQVLRNGVCVPMK